MKRVIWRSDFYVLMRAAVLTCWLRRTVLKKGSAQEQVGNVSK